MVGVLDVKLPKNQFKKNRKRMGFISRAGRLLHAFCRFRKNVPDALRDTLPPFFHP